MLAEKLQEVFDIIDRMSLEDQMEMGDMLDIPDTSKDGIKAAVRNDPMAAEIVEGFFS